MADPLQRRCVIGLGNRDRGDDAVGRIVAARLRGRVPEGISVLEHDGEPGDLLDHLHGAAAVYLVDAAISGAAPGTIQRFDILKVKLPPLRSGTSTHALGLAEALELARALDQLPARCLVYVVEAGSFKMGAALCPAVAAAVNTLTEQILADIRLETGIA